MIHGPSLRWSRETKTGSVEDKIRSRVQTSPTSMQPESEQNSSESLVLESNRILCFSGYDVYEILSHRVFQSSKGGSIPAVPLRIYKYAYT